MLALTGGWWRAGERDLDRTHHACLMDRLFPEKHLFEKEIISMKIFQVRRFGG